MKFAVFDKKTGTILRSGITQDDQLPTIQVDDDETEDVIDLKADEDVNDLEDEIDPKTKKIKKGVKKPKEPK